jgi:hypothetical protein
MARSLEVRGARADERSRDNSTDACLIQKIASDFADFVQPLQTEVLLMCGDLEHAIRRGVANRFAGTHMFFAELTNDFSPGSMLIAEDAWDVATLA